MNNNKCDHTKTQIIRRRLRWSDDDADERELERGYKEEEETISTTVDLDIGRYQCTQCKEIMYYTENWKNFWEKGEPCLGSSQFTSKKI